MRDKIVGRVSNRIRQFASVCMVAAGLVAGQPLIAAAQAPEVVAPNAPLPGQHPRIEVLNPLYDFGTVLEGQPINHVFTIKNNGDSELLINRVQTSCGCTTGEPSKKRLKPGEEADVSVAFDTRHQKGHRVRTITVFSNDPQNPSAALTLQGDVRVDVDAEPSEVSFERVPHGTEASKQVEVTYLGKDKNFNVASVSNSSPNIKVERAPLGDGKQGVKLNVTLLKSMPIGPFDDTINIVTNRQPTQVHIFGRVVGDLVLDPAQVSFGIVPHGQGVVRILRLSTSGAKPVAVTDISSSNASVKAKFEAVDSGKEYKITVELLRGTPDGQIRGQLAIKTNDPDQATLTVPFYAIVGSFQG